jgi:hypothetical protein
MCGCEAIFESAGQSPDAKVSGNWEKDTRRSAPSEGLWAQEGVRTGNVNGFHGPIDT